MYWYVNDTRFYGHGEKLWTEGELKVRPGTPTRFSEDPQILRLRGFELIESNAGQCSDHIATAE
jgi:hypothetical protein